MAGTAIAAGYFIVILGATGSISTEPGIEALSLDSVDVASGSDCTAGIVGGKLDIQANGLGIGDYCELDVIVANAGPVDAYLQRFQASYDTNLSFGIQWGDNGSGGFTDDYCGAVVPASLDAGVTPGTNTVGIMLEIDSSTDAGGTLFDDPSDGLRFMTADVYANEGCG